MAYLGFREPCALLMDVAEMPAHRLAAPVQIPLDAQTPQQYARIMREVTTLSRLHHNNIVR
jgi:hypothetical protein